MREYKIEEYDTTIRASFKCSSCSVYLVKDISVQIKRTSWWFNGPQETVVKTPKTEGVTIIRAAYQSEYRIECPKCRNGLFGKQFIMRETTAKCGGKCTSSKGHVCECSCGGANHGAGHIG